MVHNAINPPPSLPSLQPPETHPVCPNHSLSCGSLNGWITQTNMALVTSCPTKALVCSSMREHISVCVTNASTYFYLFIFFLHGFCWLNLHNHSITTAFIVLFFFNNSETILCLHQDSPLLPKQQQTLQLCCQLSTWAAPQPETDCGANG